jgi:HSP20 family protein
MSSQPSSATTADQQRGRTALSRRQAAAGVPSLLADPLEAFVNPFSLLRRMQQEVNRAFSDNSSRRNNNEDPAAAVWIPPIELAYRDGNFIVSAELPGVDDEEIQVTTTDDAVVLRGERQFKTEQDSGGVRRTELRYGEFYRAIPLPDGANPDQAKAELRNGVLQITIPVSEAKKGIRQVPVTSSTSTQPSAPQAGSTQPSGQSASSPSASGSEKAA